jgi:hypothetical protein
MHAQKRALEQETEGMIGEVFGVILGQAEAVFQLLGALAPIKAVLCLDGDQNEQDETPRMASEVFLNYGEVVTAAHRLLCAGGGQGVCWFCSATRCRRRPKIASSQNGWATPN